MALLKLRREAAADPGALGAFLQGFSIEVMPRTAEKITDFRPLLPAGTRVYIAHIEGTPIADMVATAARLRAEGFEPMPHFPARIIANRATGNFSEDPYKAVDALIAYALNKLAE